MKEKIEQSKTIKTVNFLSLEGSIKIPKKHINKSLEEIIKKARIKQWLQKEKRSK